MKSGYLITADPQLALDMVGHGGVRYAAELSDGRGFAAFDTDTHGLFMLGQLGQIFSEVPPEQQGDWDELLKRLGQAPKGPKRQSATGDERFILYGVPTHGMTATDALAAFVQLCNPRAAALVWEGAKATFFVLIETGPEWIGPEDSLWDCTTVTYRDVRNPISA